MTAKDFAPAIEADLDNEVAKEESLLQIATSWANYWAEKLEDAKTAYDHALEAIQTVGVQALAIARKTYEKATEKFEEAKSRVEEHVEALKALYVLYYEFVTPYTAK